MRRWSAVALRTTSQPRPPGRSASSRVATTGSLPELDAVGAEQRRRARRGPGPALRVVMRSSLTKRRRAAARRRRASSPRAPRSGGQPRGVLDHAGERANRASTARVRRHRAAAGVCPATSGHPQELGHTLGARKVETSGLSDCSPTAASTLATSTPVVFSGGMNTATRVDLGSSMAASRASSKSSAAGVGPSATDG